MYYIQIDDTQAQDNTLACLLWRVVQSYNPQKIKLENYTPDEKMEVVYTQGQIKAKVEVSIIKKFYIDDISYLIGFLDDDDFLYEKEEITSV